MYIDVEQVKGWSLRKNSSSILATQYLNILPMFWVLPLHMSLVADIAHLWLEKLKMPVICFSSPTLPLALLQLEYMHVIQTRATTAIEWQERSYPQGHLPGRGRGCRKIAFPGEQWCCICETTLCLSAHVLECSSGTLVAASLFHSF